MEDDKKKRKKNKKKKNKQANEPTESDKLDAKELTSDSQSHDQEIGQNNNGQVSGIVDASDDTRGHITPDGDGDGDLDNGNEVIYLAEAEKQHWLDREATLEGKIKELQAEKDAQIQKEATLEGKIKELQAEKDAQIQKEAFLEERIKQLMKENDGNSEKEASQNEKNKQLHDEKNASLQNEARLKERLSELEKVKDALIQKEGSLEQKIQQLQREMDAQLQKEGSHEQKIQHLQREMDAQLQKEASLEKEILELKGEKNSWVQKENSAKESIASLTIDNTKLRAQVVELELSRESVFSETQQLKEFISSLQLRINNLEMDKKTSENGHANYDVKTARELVERLIAENSELVEKVNELHAELEQSGVRTEQSPSDGSVPGAVTSRSAEIAGAAAPMPYLTVGADDRPTINQASGASKMIPVSDSIQSLEDVMFKDERNDELVNVNPGSRAANSSELTVQIPLDENEMKDTNLEVAAQSDDDVDV